MEGAPFFPESSPEEDDDSSFEKKDKKDSREKRLPLFEKPETDDKKKKSFELFADDKAEKKDDQQLPLDKLAEDEKQIIASEVIKDRQAEVQQELGTVEGDSAEEQEALVGATFLEALEHEVDNGTPVEHALDIAEDQAAEVADIELELDAAAEAFSDELAEASEADETADDEDDTTATPTSGAGIPPTPPTPPSPPSPPAASSPPPGGGGSGLPPIIPVGLAGTTSAPTARASRAPEVIMVPDKRRERANLLVGGLVGYFIGRRRGRIKTEKKLLPVQQKLETQVKDLTGQVLEREEKLRRAARVRYEQDPQSSKKTIERMQQLQTLKHVEKLRAVKKPERIGKLVVGAERPRPTAEKPKSVDRMTVPELLEVAAVIKIEQGSVKRLYEANHLNDEGLRRVVRAYLRGERYDHMIRQNIQSPEIYRQQTEHQDTGGYQSSAADPLRQVLQDPGTSSNFALPMLNQSHDSKQPAPTFQPKVHKSRAPIITAGVLAILVLTLLFLLI